MPHPEWLIVTHGEHGAEWNGWVYPAEIVGEVTDVCGAGDTFLSGLVAEYIRTNNIEQAIIFAQKCASIVVQKPGVATV
jgi:sugar/nucleoside kinase (ribokinase family)